ncbi:MAG: chromosomal replication initiator protein DnaA [Bacilli bacterium]
MDYNKIWEEFSTIIVTKVTEITFDTWFKNLKLYKIIDNDLYIIITLDAHKIHLTKNYYDLIQDIFYEITGKNYEIKFILQSEIENIVDNSNDINKIENKDTPTNNDYYNINLDKKYTFDSFIVGESNRFAYSSALAVAENPGKLYNPLFIYGKSGLGKTHLMHSIGNYIIEHSNKRVLYITTDQFINDFILLTKTDNTNNNIEYIDVFKKKYRDIDVLMIDDIQFMGTAIKSKEEFTNTFNNLYYNQKQIIICSDRSVDDLKMFEDRLKTRFNWGLKVTIDVPEYDLKIKIIKNKIKSGGFVVDLSDEIINFIASNCGNDVRNIEGSIIRLYAYKAMWNLKDITTDDAMVALKDYTDNLIYTENSISKIQACVASYFKLTVDDLKGKRKNKDIATARMISMYLSRMLTDETYPRIGLEFGGRDHSTVIHAYEKIKNDIKGNSELNDKINEIKQQLC